MERGFLAAARDAACRRVELAVFWLLGCAFVQSLSSDLFSGCSVFLDLSVHLCLWLVPRLC